MTIVTVNKAALTLQSNDRAVTILRDLTMEIREGEAVALVGPSGSGKSSALMLLGGLERATSGTVTVLGRDLGRLDEDELARMRRDHIGIVFQDFHLIPTMTALENVAIPLELSGDPRALETAARALDQVGLADRAQHLPAQLSGGEQQRVALARALAPGPKLLLADEPTGNLDSHTGAQIMDLMFKMREETGATLVLVTHSAELAARCERQLRMRDGRLEA